MRVRRILVAGVVGSVSIVGCAEPQAARSAADVWLIEPPTPLVAEPGYETDADVTAGAINATSGQTVRPRLRETKVLGVSEYAPASRAEEPVYNNNDEGGAASEVYDPAPPTYGVTGVSRGYSTRLTIPNVVRTYRGGSTGASTTPPVGGNWPSVPNYGPPMIGDRSKR